MKTVNHILWNCPTTMDVWSSCGKRVQKSKGCDGSFMEVMEAIFERCTREDINLFAIIANKIWARRNSVVHGGEILHPN
jgi:hypothetical protein